MSSKMKVLFSLSVVCVLCLHEAQGSAIPMWEYLSRGEKMSHLFNMFVQQVEKHCSQVSEPDCSKLLLVYGLTNLANMGDESLDDMDPYQRGANEIVWDSMMKGSDMHSTTPKPEATEMELEPGEQSAGSSIHEETQPHSFLLGPMVVRVLPNGMPIPGEKNHLPKDEDVEEFIVPKNFKAPANPSKLLGSSTTSTTTTTTTSAPLRRIGQSQQMRSNVYRPPQGPVSNYYTNSNRPEFYSNQQSYYNPQQQRRYYNEPSSTFQVRSPMYSIH